MIFDTLSHPTLTGKWIGRTQVIPTFENLYHDLCYNNYKGACAIGMAGIENYSHENFIQACNNYPTLVPIAGFGTQSIINHKEEIPYLSNLGYKGIKIHPRFSRVYPTTHFNHLVGTFKAAAAHNMVVYYCTYSHCVLKHYPSSEPLYDLIALLKETPDTKIVLAHGGDVQVLRYAELVRFNPNLLLDLSLTIMKYQGSSIDLDIRFLFQQFDRRICVGTDFPEYTHKQLLTRFNAFSEGISLEKQENIASKNIMSFLTI
jgi:predicted TIM-barrel fold metal-dependent hydrolase